MKTFRFTQPMLPALSLAVALLFPAVTTESAIAATTPQAVATKPGTKTGVQRIQQQSFTSPEAAAQALVDALRAHDAKAIQSLMGEPASWLASGDNVVDQADREKFLAAYEQKHAVTRLSETLGQLVVGNSDWTFPALLVRQSKGWVFDAATGHEEMSNRRVGRNELDAIQTLLAIVDAQREYSVNDMDGNDRYDYAQRLMSSPGKRDGLYWPAAAGDLASPLGELVANAATEGYRRSARAEDLAYHGYRYRILFAQGAHARGGAYGYLVGDKMLGGFAVVAYPARYGVSGIMTFMVNHDGQVLEKNLGASTAATVAKMKSFDPDAGWKSLQ